MTAEERAFTAAAVPAVERRTREALEAVLSRLSEAAGEALAGVALGGALGLGEARTTVDAAGEFVAAAPLELLAVLDLPPGKAATIAPRLRQELGATARSRHVTVRLDTAASSALARHAPTLEAIACAAAGRVLLGPADLLAPLAPFASAQPPLAEALRLLVRRGGALLAAERSLSRRSAPRAAVLAGQSAVRDADLALGAALLVSAGRYRPTEAERAAELRRLAAPAEGPTEPRGLHLRMTRTRFRDVVERHREAFAAAGAVELPEGLAEARTQLARASDRFLELLRLLEEERLGLPLPTWTEHVRALAARHGAAGGPGLFGGREGDDLPARRAVRDWPAPERLAPALASLLDWDPGDLGVAPLLLDLPDGAAREALAARLAALAAAV